MTTENDLELIEVSYSRPYDTKFMGKTTIIGMTPFKEYKKPEGEAMKPLAKPKKSTFIIMKQG